MRIQSGDGTRATRRIASSAATLLLAVFICIPGNARAQQASAPASQSPKVGAPEAGRILIPATLATSLDSKKRKPGDEVVVKTAATVHLRDGSVIPRGEKVVGHITEAKSRSKGDPESTLAITFDKVILEDGKSLTINGAIQAVAPNLAKSDGGSVGYSDLNQTVEHTVGASGAEPVPILDEQSEGVHGIRDLHLGPDGVLKSDGKAVKLELDSQVLLCAIVGK